MNTVELVRGESGGYVGGQAVCLGGRSVVWGGVALRMRGWEFTGWPAGLGDELHATWYPRAEALMAAAPPPSDGYAERLCRVLRPLFGGGMTASPTPMAVRYAHPPALDAGFFSTADLLVERHLAEGYPGRKPTVALQHQARWLQVAGGSVVACHVDDLAAGVRTTVRGRVFVVAAGTVESARLLQVSGLGQPFAGRGITDHAVCYCRFAIPSSSPHYSAAGAARVTLQPVAWQSHSYNVLVAVNSGLFLSRYASGGIEWLDEAVRQRAVIGEVVFLHHCPLLDSNAVGPTDPNWEGPMRLSMRPQPLADAVRRECDEVAARVIRGLGGIPLDGEPVRCTLAPLGNVAHEVGTLRMAAGLGQGVVGSDLRAHGLANLYVCDLSVFPNSPAANPSLTLVALALRLADTIASRFSRR
jgi:choline dehydrogenase-like flavoprotein